MTVLSHTWDTDPPVDVTVNIGTQPVRDGGMGRYLAAGARGSGLSPMDPYSDVDQAFADMQTGAARVVRFVTPGVYTLARPVTITGTKEYVIESISPPVNRRFSMTEQEASTVLRLASPADHVVRFDTTAGNAYGITIRNMVFNPMDLIPPAQEPIDVLGNGDSLVKSAIDIRAHAFVTVDNCVFGLKPGAHFRPVYLVKGDPGDGKNPDMSWWKIRNNSGWGTCLIHWNGQYGSGGPNRMDISGNVFSGIGPIGTQTGGAKRPFVHVVATNPTKGSHRWMARNSFELTDDGVPAVELVNLEGLFCGPDGFERLGQGKNSSGKPVGYRITNCDAAGFVGSTSGSRRNWTLVDGGGNTNVDASGVVGWNGYGT